MGLTKNEFEIINKIAQEHSNKVFGYLSKEDLVNEIWVICLENLSGFDPKRGSLEHYLRVLVRTRLINKFKDITKTVNSPCPKCEFYDLTKEGECGAFGENKVNKCDKWQKYQKLVNARNNLLNSSEDVVERFKDLNSLDSIIIREIYEKIKIRIENEFKRDLENLINGNKSSVLGLRKLSIRLSQFAQEEWLSNNVELRINGKKSEAQKR